MPGHGPCLLPPARLGLLGAAGAWTGLGRSPRPDLSNGSGSGSTRPGPAPFRAAAVQAAPPRSQLSHPHPGTDTPTAGASLVLTPSCSSSPPPPPPPTRPPGSSFLPAPPLPAQAGFEKYRFKSHLDPSPAIPRQPGRRKGAGPGTGALCLAQPPTCWITLHKPLPPLGLSGVFTEASLSSTVTTFIKAETRQYS